MAPKLVLPPKPKPKLVLPPKPKRILGLGYGPLVVGQDGPQSPYPRAVTRPTHSTRPKPSVAPGLRAAAPKLKAVAPNPKSMEESDWMSSNYSNWWSSDWWWQDWRWNSWNFTEKWSQGPADNDEDDGLEQQASDDYEVVTVEEEGDHDDLVKQTQQVLERNRGQKRGSGSRSPVKIQFHRSGKQGKHGRSTLRSGKASSKRAKTRYAKRDGQGKLTKLEVGELRYSQLSCKETFQCGRSISQLVQDLLRQRVSLSAAFLRLTVFETIDEKTKEPILRCIDNRRLYALKEYAKRSGKDRVMVNVNLFSQNTLKQCQRFIQNSDETEGRNVRLRRSKRVNHRQPWI